MGGATVVDAGSGLYFHHDFSRDTTGMVTEATIEREYKVARAKVQFLLQRWRLLVRSSDPVLYITLNGEVPEKVLRLQQLMRAHYPDHPFSLLWVRRPEDAGFVEPPEGITQATVTSAAEGPRQWQGDDAAWDEVFEQVGL
jgi:hypothetical protein